MPIVFPAARAALFKMPAETAHDVVIRAVGSMPKPVRGILRKANGADPMLRSHLFGVDFPSPVGLGAGFDKAGAAFNGLGALGFGFVEIGTVTAREQEGNPKPRLFRLPEDRAIINRMGFNNPGADKVALRLSQKPAECVLGINIGKSKVTPLQDAVEDYLYSLEALKGYADYMVINVSSPNTPGLRELQDAGPLRELLDAVVEAASKESGARVPVLVKLAPDLSDEQLEQAVGIAVESGCSGIIATNTTIERNGLRRPSRDVDSLGAGGLSGEPLRVRAHQVISRIYRLVGREIPIIGVGGIMTDEDAWTRIRAGASLIQLYSGFVYSGPGLIRQIHRGLARRMERHGFKSLSEVVGTVGA